mgnify:CR=1 FL=1
MDEPFETLLDLHERPVRHDVHDLAGEHRADRVLLLDVLPRRRRELLQPEGDPLALLAILLDNLDEVVGMLDDAGIEYEELVLNRDFSEVTLRAVAGASMVPQVFINGEHVGGSDALEGYLAHGRKSAA